MSTKYFCRELLDDRIPCQRRRLIGSRASLRVTALKTWVFAILKNKIADVLRHKHRMCEASSLLHKDEENEDLSETV